MPYTEEHWVAVIYVDDCKQIKLKMKLPKKRSADWTPQSEAEIVAKAILKAWLVLTAKEANLAWDEDDADDWSVISVHGNATKGTWMAICGPYRGEDVTFVFDM